MPAQSIPLYRVQLALQHRQPSQRLAAMLRVINQFRVCPRTVALPRTVTYDGYGRIYH